MKQLLLLLTIASIGFAQTQVPPNQVKSTAPAASVLVSIPGPVVNRVAYAQLGPGLVLDLTNPQVPVIRAEVQAPPPTFTWVKQQYKVCSEAGAGCLVTSALDITLSAFTSHSESITVTRNGLVQHDVEDYTYVPNATPNQPGTIRWVVAPTVGDLIIVKFVR